MRPSRVIVATLLIAVMVGADYGDKVKSNSTSTSSNSEAFGSSEEYYDDSLEEKQTAAPEKVLTTPDDGVVIEKAILAAEITPKASYSLIDNPIRYDESLDNSYTQAKFVGNNDFFGYSSSDSNSKEEINTVFPSKDSGNDNGSRNSLYKTVSSKSKSETMQKSPQTYSYNFPSWSFLGMYNVPSQMTQKTFSASYKNPTDYDTTKAAEIKNNGVGLSEDGNYDPVANGDYLHLGYEGSSEPWSASGSALSPDVLVQLEQERQSQIQSTQLHLKQIEAAQEYATKVQALQDALYSNFQSPQEDLPGWSDYGYQETFGSSTTPETPQASRAKDVPKTEAPVVTNVAHQNTYSLPFYTPASGPSPVQVNSLAGSPWMFPGMSTVSPVGFSPYTGPTASPVVLPSGFLADTEEVMQARIAHLQALMNAIESTSAWKGQRSDRWS